MVTLFLFIILGLVILVLGGHWLLKAAVDLSLRMAIPRIIIGMTVVSFATSAPELIVSVTSAVEGLPDLALGNVVGSNIANLGLVLAIAIILGPMDIRPGFYTVDWPLLMVTSLLFYFFLANDQQLTRVEGGIMVVCLFLFLVLLLRFQKTAVVPELGDAIDLLPLHRTVLYLILGAAGLWGGSELLIEGASGMAASYGVSERVIGITVVSVGTSIPELAASVIAVMKKEKAISLGNLIGSNIFNILAVLGITSLIIPVPVRDAHLLQVDVWWMLGFSLIILPLVFIPKGLRLGWRDGILLLLGYMLFLYMTI